MVWARLRNTDRWGAAQGRNSALLAFSAMLPVCWVCSASVATSAATWLHYFCLWFVTEEWPGFLDGATLASIQSTTESPDPWSYGSLSLENNLQYWHEWTSYGFIFGISPMCETELVQAMLYSERLTCVLILMLQTSFGVSVGVIILI